MTRTPADVAVDHAFVCCDVGAPEAEALLAAGFAEGPPNVHPGQGTACRRFALADFYLELFWVADPAEAAGPRVEATGLFERWSRRLEGACPVWIVLRPERPGTPAPFPHFHYRPGYLPPDASFALASDPSLTEPGYFFLSNLPRRGPLAGELPFATLAAVEVWGPLGSASAARRALETLGVVSFHEADEYRLELSFEPAPGRSAGVADLRPRLPVVLRW